ncbi:MAG: molybdenum cofactor guanylyltransferase [Actinomycetota bacterium]
MLVGYVLAGGRSRRFGRDKSLVVIDGLRAMEHQVSVLAPICDGPVTVVGTQGNEVLGAAVIGDVGGRQGPLDGLVTALDHAASLGATRAAVVAVDLWNLTSEIVARLAGEFDEALDDVVHLRAADSRRDQPLCAVWSVASSLPVLEAAFASGERSVVRAWAGLRRRAFDVDDPVLVNVNTPEDYARWAAARSIGNGKGS